MAFDGGVKQEGLPFDLPSAVGRTDMLGRRHYADFWTYRRLGTLATHAEYEGPLGREFEPFERSFLSILERANLTGALRSSAWVFQHARRGDDAEAHERMVGKFTNAWLRASRRPDLGVIREVQAFLKSIDRSIKAKMERLLRV